MKPGDLIRFLSTYTGYRDWYGPGIIIDQFPKPDQSLFVVMIDAESFLVISDNTAHYDVEVISEGR